MTTILFLLSLLCCFGVVGAAVGAAAWLVLSNPGAAFRAFKDM